MTKSIPSHRRATGERSGDSIVIDKDGKATNVDAVAREKAAGAKQRESTPKSRSAKTDTTKDKG